MFEIAGGIVLAILFLSVLPYLVMGAGVLLLVGVALLLASLLGSWFAIGVAALLWLALIARYRSAPQNTPPLPTTLRALNYVSVFLWVALGWWAVQAF